MTGGSLLDADAAQDARSDRHLRVLPAMTATGFERVRVPREIFRRIERWYRERADRGSPEQGVADVVRSASAAPPSDLVRIDHASAFAQGILEGMQPVLEAWCGEALVPESIYGVRVYREGAVLARHVDRVETHAVSAVLLIAEDVERPWPLVLAGTDGSRNEVVLAPGQALLYEGARLPHCRDRPLRGRSYAAVFIHYRPLWWSYTPAGVEALAATAPLRSLAYGRPDAVQAPVASSTGYLAFQPDYGGWNNVLMQLEIMVALAWLTGRTLVLPPAKRHYLLGDRERELDAFLDLQHLGRHLPVLRAGAFAEHAGIDAFADYEAFSAWMAAHGRAPGWNALDDVLVHPADALARRPELAARVGTRRVLHVDDAFEQAELVYFPMTEEHRMFGVAETFFLLGDASLERRLRRLLRDALRYHPALVALAERALRAPALGCGFAAMHVRRGDFQYPETQIDADRILAHTRRLFAPGQTIYLATDHDDRSFFDPLRREFHMVTFPDLGVAADTPPHWTGIVETLVCAGAPGPFVGTRLSTFSNRIATLRGHLARTRAGRDAGIDAALYYTQPPLDAAADEARPYGPRRRDHTDELGESRQPWWESVARVPLWGRAYQAVWMGTDDEPQEILDA